jgi:hypothetical protein
MTDETRDETLVMLTCRVPAWLKAEMERAARQQLTDTSAIVRAALRAWLKCQGEEAA